MINISLPVLNFSQQYIKEPGDYAMIKVHKVLLNTEFLKCLTTYLMIPLFVLFYICSVSFAKNIPVIVPDHTTEASNLWYEGVPLGNGDLGILCYGADDILIYAIGKNDFWDRRYDDKHQPHPKPVAKIKIWQPIDQSVPKRKSLQPVLHKLSYQTAELITKTPNFDVIARVQKNDNVIVLQLKNIKEKTFVTLYRHADSTKTGIKPPIFDTNNLFGYMIQDMPADSTYPDGFRCVAMAKIINAGKPVSHSNDISWEIMKDCSILIGVATTRDNVDPAPEAKALVLEATECGNEEYKKLHLDAWAGYWNKSWISCDDKTVENLWYQWNYIFASATRPDAIAPGLFSPWIVRDESQWRNSYTIDYNFQQNFSAALSSNHPELMEPYFTEVERMLPVARKLSRDKYGKEGLFFPHEMFPIHLKKWPSLAGALMETLWLLQHFWEYYEYTLDREFLINRCYPIIAECADFLLRLIDKGDDGRYHIKNYKSFEHPKIPNSKNGTSEIGFTKYILKAAIKGASVLNTDKEKIKKWTEILDGLVPYPTQKNQLGEIYVDCVHQDSAFYVTPPVELIQGGWRPSKLKGNHGLWMYFNLAQPLLHVWPGAQIDMDSPPKDLLTAMRTWMTIKLEGSNNLVPHHVQAARLGINSYNEFKKDIEYRRMTNGFITTKVNPVSANFDYDWGYFQFWTYGIFIENCGIPFVINEMMLQSQKEIIRVFPIFDPYGRAEFHHLGARGGFTVSASMDRGFVEWIEIIPSVNRNCKVRPPWPGDTFIIVELPVGTEINYRKVLDNIEFAAKKDHQYKLTPKTKTYRE
jgi:hypothetical protein